jgi:hypothetical protein
MKRNDDMMCKKKNINDEKNPNLHETKINLPHRDICNKKKSKNEN